MKSKYSIRNWKSLYKLLSQHGVVCPNPRKVLQSDTENRNRPLDGA